MLRGDLRVLKAGLGEHQRLRIHRNLQEIEDRAQIAVLGLVYQLCFAGGELLLQLGYRIAEIVGAIIDRRVTERNVSLVADGDLRIRRGCQSHQAQADAEETNHDAPPATSTGTDKWIVFGGWHSRSLQV